MALGTCKECNNKVSTKATACPACGAPVKARSASGEGWGFLLIVAGMLTAMAAQPPISTWGGVACAAGFVVFIMGRMR